jgi:transcriptional regulator with XRE-family HTH domain
MAKIGHNSGVLWLHRSYNNVEKNPEIDRARTLIRQETKLKEKDLAVIAGLAGSTVQNMFGGKTRDPRGSTFTKLYAAIGFKLEPVRDHKVDFDKELPIARQQFADYRKTLKKRREREQDKKPRKAKANGKST